MTEITQDVHRTGSMGEAVFTVSRPVFQTLERTNDQRRDALIIANGIRVERAKMKERLKSGTEQAIDILKDVPPYARTMKAMDLLLAIPKYGKYKASRTLSHCRVAQSKTLAGLTDRQREQIIEQLQVGNGS